jgi:acyl-CoA synthetase (AMP-forming)/AMP-acid ligase II
LQEEKMTVQSNSDAIFRGPTLSYAIPSVTLPTFIRGHARQRPNAVALVDAASGRNYTYGALDHLIGRFAAGLAAQGFRPGDTLLMFAPNLPEWPIAALGAMAVGGVVSGANPMYNATDLAHQMREAKAKFAFTVPLFLPLVREAAAAAGCEKIILLGEAEGTLSFASLLACTDPEPIMSSDPDALVALPFSSGTTGLAKGVMLTHRTLVSNICQFNEAFPSSVATPVVLAFLPMFHIFGFTIVTLCGFANGSKLVTVPRFEPEPFLKAIADFRVTHLFVVPPVMQFLAGHPMVDAHDLSSIELIGCGAAPLGAALETKVSERLKCPVAQGFGMTESSGCVTISHPDRLRPGSSGQLIPGTQGRIVDPETGMDVSPGKPGEFWFRGPQNFTGYLNRPDATAETITADGWVRTGDIGVLDADGYLTITDRLKELIKVKGFQVAPAELEALLLTHPAVADAAVISRPDERAGELPVAYIVGRGAVDGEAIKAWVAERVVEYKQLGDVVSCEAIPKNPSGKILRRVLRTTDAARNNAIVK